MLLQHDGSEEGGFQAMRAVVIDDAAETAERRSSSRLGVVRQTVEKPLHSERRAQTGDQTTFAQGKGPGGRRTAFGWIGLCAALTPPRA